MGEAYRFGIEEEYFLADAHTGRTPDGAVADRFHAVAGERVKPASHELLKGQVEVCTDPGIDCEAAEIALRGLRRALSGIAGDHGLALFAAGSHPLARARQQDTTEAERYRKLEEEIGIVATRSMVCATHVHVEVPDPTARIALMNRLLPDLPLFLALSVSSPFWQGRDSRQQGFRLTAFAEWPRVGLPEIFTGEAEYERFVSLLVNAGAIKDASFIWWMIRPSTHYPTIELRICDGCTNVRDTVAIAALYRCLVRAAVRCPDRNRGVGPIARGVCAQNVWHAQRDGVAARFIDAETGATSSVGDMLEKMLALVAEDADALGCADTVEETRAIVERGTSADRQLARFAEARAQGDDDEAALRAVVTMLADDTVA